MRENKKRVLIRSLEKRILIAAINIQLGMYVHSDYAFYLSIQLVEARQL